MNQPHLESFDLPSRKLQVLIVEDNPFTAQSLSRLLEVYGFEVHVAADGPTALAWSQFHEPDVVLLDIGLPGGMDGYEVARCILAKPVERPPLLVALTGQGEDEDRQLSQEVGIHLHLTKPVAPEQLQWLLNRFGRVVLPTTDQPQEMISGN